MHKIYKLSTLNNNVDRNTVYTQMYTEMRRFRDYIFSGSTWYTALMLAILAFVVTPRFSGVCPQSRLTAIMIHSVIMKIILVILTVLIVFSSCYNIYYAFRRYTYNRIFVSHYLEPEWKNKIYDEDKIKFQPHHLLYATQALIGLILLSAILIPM